MLQLKSLGLPHCLPRAPRMVLSTTYLAFVTQSCTAWCAGVSKTFSNFNVKVIGDFEADYAKDIFRRVLMKGTISNH